MADRGRVFGQQSQIMPASVCGEDEVGSANAEKDGSQSRSLKAVKERVGANATSSESVVLRFVQSVAADNITPRLRPVMRPRVPICKFLTSDSGLVPVRAHLQIGRRPSHIRMFSKPAYMGSNPGRHSLRHELTVTRCSRLSAHLAAGFKCLLLDSVVVGLSTAFDFLDPVSTSTLRDWLPLTDTR